MKVRKRLSGPAEIVTGRGPDFLAGQATPFRKGLPEEGAVEPSETLPVQGEQVANRGERRLRQESAVLARHLQTGPSAHRHVSRRKHCPSEHGAGEMGGYMSATAAS